MDTVFRRELLATEAQGAALTPPARRGNHYGNPLKVQIERGALVIRIGIDTLAYAMKFADWSIQFDETKDDYLQRYRVVDATELAKDVIHAMLREEEDGSTPLSDFLDKMTESAVQDGSLGVDDDPNPSNPYQSEKNL
jgi:hypothetical protein